MADLVLALEPDPDLRERFLREARRRAAPFPGLEVRETVVGNLAAVWAFGAQAPRAESRSGDALGLLLGYAMDEDGRHMSADDFVRQRHPESALLPVCDGFFLAVAYSVVGGLAISVDPLGFFPLFHADCAGSPVIATAPGLFAAHPRFEGGLDLRGLAGILLTNGLVAGRGLSKGVHRLAAGHQLLCPTGGPAREVEAYRLAVDRASFAVDQAEALERAEAEFRRAVRRHRPPDASAVLMLSGGLDSRLMAACLDADGATRSAVCLGRTSDLEHRAASAVARRLGWDLHGEAQEPRPDAFLASTRRVVAYEELSGGLGALDFTLAGPTLASLSPWNWSGFVVEEIIGGFAYAYGRDPDTGQWSAHRFFTKINGWGLPPDRLASLLRPEDVADLVGEVKAAVCRRYDRPGESPAQGSFRMKLETRGRYHIGQFLHRLCFFSWPLLPALDRRLVHLAYNLPPETMLHRRIESDLLRRMSPGLSRVPFDTNSFHFEPDLFKGMKNVPRLLQAGVTLRFKAREWYWTRWRHAEPRRYYRYYDLDGPYWKAVRQAAEPDRRLLDSWMRREEVDRLLPPPDHPIPLRDRFAEGSIRRMLLGLMLWAGERT